MLSYSKRVPLVVEHRPYEDELRNHRDLVRVPRHRQRERGTTRRLLEASDKHFQRPRFPDKVDSVEFFGQDFQGSESGDFVSTGQHTIIRPQKGIYHVLVAFDKN